jgi:hypothetical protein
MHKYPAEWFERVTADLDGIKKVVKVMRWRGFPVVESKGKIRLPKPLEKSHLDQKEDLKVLKVRGISVVEDNPIDCTNEKLRNLLSIPSPHEPLLNPGIRVNELDPPLALLIEVLNLIGIKTSDSCAGHKEGAEGQIEFDTANDLNLFTEKLSTDNNEDLTGFFKIDIDAPRKITFPAIQEQHFNLVQQIVQQAEHWLEESAVDSFWTREEAAEAIMCAEGKVEMIERSKAENL